MAEKEKRVELRVGEIPPNAQSDIGIGIVRIDTKVMQELRIREGDVVDVTGKRGTGAVAVRPYPSDAGLKIIRMDGYTRRNAGTGIGEKVTVKKAEVADAKSVTLAPAEKGIIIQVPKEQAARMFMGRVVNIGDVIVPAGRRRARPAFEEFFGMGFEELFPGFGLTEARFIVVNASPKGVCRITEASDVKVLEKSVEVPEEAAPGTGVTYEDIGGLKEEVKKVREMIELPLKHPELFHKLGIEPPKGVLLYGPPGTGKTLLAKAVAGESGANFFSIAGPEVMSKFYGESEENVRKIFKEAEDSAPSIIFIDEIDALAPKREQSGEVERRVVAQLLSLMDGLKARGQIIVIAATNRPNDIDPALRRGGRFDREIELGVPTREGRREILQIHTRNMPLAKNVDLNKIADVSHGHVGADINALCKEAAMSSLRRVMPKLKLKEETIPTEVIENLEVTKKDFQDALLMVEPSAMREVLVEIPKVKWIDIGGLEDAKGKLREMVEWPLEHPESFKRMGIRPPRGVLLHGLPGTGKTMLAKAVANESQSNFIYVKGPEIFNKYVGESEKAIREVFRRARQVAPAIIFLDEIDSLAPRRGTGVDSHVTDRVVNQLLTELDGLEGLEGVVVIAATNRPDIIDAGLLRTGRFDRHIYVPVPDKASRKKIFKIYTREMPLAKNVNIDRLVEKTENYVGADIEAICREAGINALRKDINVKEVTKDDFEAAMARVKPAVTPDQIKGYSKHVEKSKITSDEEALAYIG